MLMFYKFNALVLFIIFNSFVHFSSNVQLYVAEFNVIFPKDIHLGLFFPPRNNK